jgi:hypothetical protein
MMTYNGEFHGASRFLWLIRFACWISGSTWRVWKARNKREGKVDANG